MNQAIAEKQEAIRFLVDSPCFSGKHKKLKTLRKQLFNLTKKQTYKNRGSHV